MKKRRKYILTYYKIDDKLEKFEPTLAKKNICSRRRHTTDLCIL